MDIKRRAIIQFLFKKSIFYKYIYLIHLLIRTLNHARNKFVLINLYGHILRDNN